MLEIPTVCYVTNYDLVVEKTGKKLEDFESVYESGLSEYDVIKMVPTLYTSISAEFHLSRINYILNEHPPFYNKNTTGEIISRDLEKLIATSKDYFNTMNEVRQKMMGANEGAKEKAEEQPKEENKAETKQENKPETKQDKKQEIKSDAKAEAQKDSKQETKQPEKSESKKETNPSQIEEALKSMNDIRQKISEMDFKKFSLINFPESFIYEDNPKPQKFLCLNYIQNSIFNQTVKENERRGDLIYLEIFTLEGLKLNVTCSEKGFFLNNSNHSTGVFDPKPAPHPCYSYTLVGLLSQASPMFKENFSKLIGQILNVDTTIYLPSPSNKFDWLKTHDNSFFYNYRYKAFNTELESLKHMRLNKEWNEEYQAIIDLNFATDPLQNLTKEKLLFDFYKLFRETAVEGAKLIREKKITPFNFFDNPRANSGYYMYGSIFFTVLEDNYLDFRTFTKDDQRQTCLGSNLDLRHINYINSVRHSLELKDFYFSLNCIVQYKGLRVHAQVITPGVIFNSEHLVEYGEGEEGVIKYNEKFHEDYKKFCEKLNIREISVTDKNSKEYQICGNPEIKGVRGVDKRKYLFDLIHLFPRDLNYEGADCNGCLLRPELIKEYQLKQIHAKTNTDYQEELKKINAEVPNESVKDPTAYFQFFEEKYKKKEELFEKINAEVKPMLTMDTTIGIENKFFQFKNENLEKDTELLKNLGKFLKEEIIGKFLEDVSKDEENAPNDSFSLSEYMHKYGIPMRYYGEIIRLIESEPKFKKMNNWIKSLAVRDIIRRCSKHIFNNLIKDVPDYLIKDFCAYFLNIILAPSSAIKNLEKFDMTYKDGTITNVKSVSIEGDTSVKTETTSGTTHKSSEKPSSSSQKKKKNKKKNKKNKETGDKNEMELKFLINETFTSNNKFFNSLFELKNEEVKKFFIKPSELWGRIKEIALKRYGYTFPEKQNFDNVEPIINKFGLLRDLCLTVGIQIEATDYELHFDSYSNQRQDLFKYQQMPFNAEHIVDFFPVVKDSGLPSEIHKPIYDQAEALFKSGSFIEASEKYKQLIYLSNEVYGQINHFSGIAHKKLGEISYLDGDYMNGIIMIQKAIVIFEKLYDYDTNLVANAYSELSTYYHLINQDYLAFKYISRGLEILNFTYPKNHPELVNRVCNLAMYYVDMDLIDNAKDLIESSIKLCTVFFEEDDKNVSLRIVFNFKFNSIFLVTTWMAHPRSPFTQNL